MSQGYVLDINISEAFLIDGLMSFFRTKQFKPNLNLHQKVGYFIDSPGKGGRIKCSFSEATKLINEKGGGLEVVDGKYSFGIIYDKKNNLLSISIDDYNFPGATAEIEKANNEILDLVKEIIQFLREKYPKSNFREYSGHYEEIRFALEKNDFPLPKE